VYVQFLGRITNMTTTYEVYYREKLIAENADRDYALHAAGDWLNEKAAADQWDDDGIDYGTSEVQLVGIDEHGAEVLAEDIELEWTTEEGGY